VSTQTKTRWSKRRAVASTRVNLRIHPQVKAALVRAARLQQVRLTEFMLKASLAAAETTLAERTRFFLPPRKWREFNAALDSPPRFIPVVHKLFNEPSALSAEQ